MYSLKENLQYWLYIDKELDILDNCRNLPDEESADLIAVDGVVEAGTMELARVVELLTVEATVLVTAAWFDVVVVVELVLVETVVAAEVMVPLAADDVAVFV